MDRVVSDFIALLRRHRVRVSPAEGLDALEGLRLVGLAEREGVRDALRTTLVKSGEDTATFERLFDLYFGLQPEPVTPARVHPHVHDNGGTATELRFGEDLDGDPDDGDHDHSHAGPEPIDLRRFLDEDKLRPSHDIHGESERLRLSVFGQQLMLNRNPEALQQALRSATHQLRVTRARSFNPGAVAPETGAEELPVELPPAGFDELVEDLRELGVDERLVAALAAQADDILRALPELLKELLERRRRLAEPTLDDEEITRRSLRTLLDLPPADQAELEAALRRLGRQIHGARGRRLKPDRVGRISVPHTLRRNLSYEGVPFEPVLRRRREQRPRLVVLCDVSLSTRNLARFWLHLVYGLQDLFSKVRTFVFVADVAEVTQLFEAQTLFGRAAEQLAGGLEAGLGRRTTVVVLGDGRNNGRSAKASALEEIAARARQLIWITPEPKWGWTLGGCDMPLYERICTRVEVVRTAEELGAVAETLVRDAA